MKIRIYRNSLRLRLSRTDVTALKRRGIIAETTQFGLGRKFSYSLEMADAAETIRASLRYDAINIEVPTLMAIQWSENSAVGLRHCQQVGDGEILDILIEKDFECLDAKMTEPGEQLYPNPNKQCVPVG